jgi:hypothetical protein
MGYLAIPPMEEKHPPPLGKGGEKVAISQVDNTIPALLVTKFN